MLLGANGDEHHPPQAGSALSTREINCNRPCFQCSLYQACECLSLIPRSLVPTCCALSGTDVLAGTANSRNGARRPARDARSEAVEQRAPR
eukprot:2788917-Rhodomonas_salina.1